MYAQDLPKAQMPRKLYNTFEKWLRETYDGTPTIG
jgi:hypothetical protein